MPPWGPEVGKTRRPAGENWWSSCSLSTARHRDSGPNSRQLRQTADRLAPALDRTAALPLRHRLELAKHCTAVLHVRRHLDHAMCRTAVLPYHCLESAMCCYTAAPRVLDVRSPQRMTRPGWLPGHRCQCLRHRTRQSADMKTKSEFKGVYKKSYT